MNGKIENEGYYELFRTNKGHDILSLNDKKFFAVIKGQKGDMLIATDSDHQKDETLKKGKFYLVSFEDDPEFRNFPHLFLQEGSRYREWILPNDRPTEKDYQKKLIKTGNLVSRTIVEEHIKGKEGEAPDKQYRRRSRGKPVDLKSKSRNELYNLAKKRNVPGRSKMKKEQLIRELE